MGKRQPKNRQQKIATGKFNNEKMTGVGKKANVKLVFRRESNSLFRSQKQWHGLWGIVCYDPSAEKLSNTSTAMTNR